jgi:hypothetical protein
MMANKIECEIDSSKEYHKQFKGTTMVGRRTILKLLLIGGLVILPIVSIMYRKFFTKNVINFSEIDFVLPKEKFGVFRPNTKNWNDLFGNKQIDLGDIEIIQLTCSDIDHGIISVTIYNKRLYDPEKKYRINLRATDLNENVLASIEKDFLDKRMPQKNEKYERLGPSRGEIDFTPAPTTDFHLLFHTKEEFERVANIILSVTRIE